MPRASSKSSASPATAAPAENGAAAADKGSSIESIAQDIATAIVEKRLPPGTWLREEALGRVYSVSRTKIRAALLMLSKDKLIEMIPDKGAFVCQPTVQEAREVFAVRRILESEVVRLFIANARPRDYQVLEQHIRFERTALRQTTTTGTVREKVLGDFHVALAEATGNKTLAELVRELVARSSLIAMLYQSSHNAACSSQQHAKFLEAAISGDTDHAVRLMIEHLNEVEAGLQFDAGAGPAKRDLVNALLMVNGA